MTINSKGRAGSNQVTSDTTSYRSHFTAFTIRMKAAIIRLALWGWLPMCFANWISNREGQCND